MVVYLKNRTVDQVWKGLNYFLGLAKSRKFECVNIVSDGEGAVKTLQSQLEAKGIQVNIVGPGQHVPQIERLIQTVKQRIRGYDSTLPFVMCKILLIFCVAFCVSRVNLQPSTTLHQLNISPNEMFSGMRLNAKRDLRCGFGEYLQARVPETSNSMGERTQGCIALLPMGNLSGSVKMFALRTEHVVTRDQFQLLPMPDEVIAKLNSLAEKDGITRGMPEVMGSGFGAPECERMPAKFFKVAPPNDHDPEIGNNIELPEQYYDPAVEEVRLEVPSSTEEDQQSTLEVEIPTTEMEDTTVDSDISTSEVNEEEGPPQIKQVIRTSGRERKQPTRDPMEGYALCCEEVFLQKVFKPEMNHQVLHEAILLEATGNMTKYNERANWTDNANERCYVTSIRQALRTRGEEAKVTAMAEIKQMLDKRVWHPIHTTNLSVTEVKSVIRSSMFMKEKKTATGEFDKYKGRLVAGGDQQDKELYENLAAPTAASASTFTIAAIAAHEHREIATIDIGGAFLHAKMDKSVATVRMRLDRLLTEMVVELDKTYKRYVSNQGTLVVELDRALYGCVEAAVLWYNCITDTLKDYGFTPNAYDCCVLNKEDPRGQITVVLHVDDLLITCTDNKQIEELNQMLMVRYGETKLKQGKVLDYLGMTFDFLTEGEVSITMDGAVNDIIESGGVHEPRATPAATTLFDVRDAPKATKEEGEYFHSHVAKLLYVAKRVKPEMLTAVAFLSTRVNCCDMDDLAKLKRLLGYLFATSKRGITLRIGEEMTVRAYIDAAYGVHTSSGKSHTGCAIVLGDGGPVFSAPYQAIK